MSKISVITINYNNAGGLERTIKSVLSQSYDQIEYIIIDGLSTDRSKQVIEQYAHKLAYWISESDNGIYDAQNKGILKATGDYLLFLNSGDVLVDEKVIEKVANQLADASFYYGNLLLDKDSKQTEHKAPSVIDVDFMLNSTFWHPCVFIKSTLFKEFGLYNPTFKICGDYEFFIRCLLKPNVTTHYLNLLITKFDGNGISNDDSVKDIQQQEREQAWLLNISTVLYQNLKAYNAFSRSKYASIINTVQSFRGKRRF